MAKLPLGSKELKIGILGMTEGNGHPYSWSAMFNGFDPEKMAACPFPVIPQYLAKQPPHKFGIEGAKITHICCTGYAERAEAEKIAGASKIPYVVDKPEDMLGQVDAVICATDIGAEHIKRCAPFLEAGLPMFIDKPLVDSEEDLKVFLRWRAEGKQFISSSSMRYEKEIEPFYATHYELGDLMYICRPMSKTYETYGIHALESVYPMLGPGFLSVQNTGTAERAMVHLIHQSGCRVDIAQGVGMSGAGMLLVGSKESRYIATGDSYSAFKKQLDLFVHWLRTGEEPFPFSQTVELMKLIIAGIRSRDEGGRIVYLSEIGE